MSLIDTPNPKQLEFCMAETRFIAYGGARGGGKSWAVRTKAKLMCLNYHGIRILLLRRTYPELRENHILPLIADTAGYATYKETEKAMTFPEGSRLKFGYCDSDADITQYQGQEYDVIFLDEATQFSEYQFSVLTACLRGANSFPKRFYLTCNPGGIGHGWVKRLFIDRQYKEGENPDDYTFIPARVDDNKAIMDNDPGYVQMLRNLPEKLRLAWLEGRWDVYAGQYFTEFSEATHVVDPFPVPQHWRRYFTMDYGLDMFAGYFVAIDESGRAYVYREIYRTGIIVSEAIRLIREAQGSENIYQFIAPPDMWNRRQETGKSVADLFSESGISLAKANPDRERGWLQVHEWLQTTPDQQGIPTPYIRIFRSCANLIRCLPLLQFDEKKPNDVATEPHEYTHSPDAIRYFISMMPEPAPKPEPVKHYNFEIEKPKVNTVIGGQLRVI